MKWSRVGYLILLTIIIISSYILISNVYANLIVTENGQGVTIKIVTNDENGAPVIGARVRLFTLSREIRVLGEGVTDTYGLAVIHVIIPRKLITIEKGKPIFTPINLAVSTWRRVGNLAGAYAFSLDPTWMKWPEDVHTVNVTLKKINIGKTSQMRPQEYNPDACITYTETSAYTEVLRFATWDDIKAWYYYPYGAKLEFQVKGRYTNDPCYDTSWIDWGTAQVTLDSSFALPSEYALTGRYVHSLFFKIIYGTYGWMLPDFYVYQQLVFPVDTSTDPRSAYESHVPWDGKLPGYSYYYETPGTDVRGIPVTGGVRWDFSVTVSFSVGYPFGVSMSVGLGVGKISEPNAFLYIQGMRASPSYVRTESPDTTFLKSYSNWGA